MPYRIPPPPPEVKKVYLLAMFLHRPDTRFEFDHVWWRVEYAQGFRVFEAATEDFLSLNRLYEELQISETCHWEISLAAAETVIRQAHYSTANGPKIKCYPERRVNWKRDGF
jgi:hypothetical protein